MILQTFDLANRTGIATGVPGSMPKQVVAAIVKPPKSQMKAHEVAWRFGRFLDELWTFDRPNFVVVEDFMNPAGSKSDKATISALLMRGVLEGACGRLGIPCRPVHMATARVHFCGRASAAPRRDGPRTKQQEQDDRYDTNMMVWRRAVQLGYFSRGDVPDFDKGSAVCLYDYASHTFYRKASASFQLFEGNQ